MSEGAPTALRKGSVLISGHRTSISLENAFWHLLRTIAAEQNRSVNQVVAEVDKDRTANLSSAVRVYILNWLISRDPVLRAQGFRIGR